MKIQMNEMSIKDQTVDELEQMTCGDFEKWVFEHIIYPLYRNDYDFVQAANKQGNR